MNISMKTRPSEAGQIALDALKTAVANALEKKSASVNMPLSGKMARLSSLMPMLSKRNKGDEFRVGNRDHGPSGSDQDKVLKNNIKRP